MLNTQAHIKSTFNINLQTQKSIYRLKFRAINLKKKTLEQCHKYQLNIENIFEYFQNSLPNSYDTGWILIFWLIARFSYIFICIFAHFIFFFAFLFALHLHTCAKKRENICEKYKNILQNTYEYEGLQIKTIFNNKIPNYP